MRNPNWLSHFIRWGKARFLDRRARTYADVDYEAEYRRYREEGLSALAQDRVQVAIKALGHAALFRPNEPEAHFSLGRALVLAGKIEAARQAYLRALELQPNLSEVRTALLKLPPLPPARDDFHVNQRLSVADSSTTYTVLKVKKGGFGAVYIVEDCMRHERWALKTFQAKFLWSDEDRRRFEREAVNWIMLDHHPNIVSAQGLDVIEGFPCLCLEYLPHNLAEVLQVGRLSPKGAAALALQFCDGMFYAHRKLGIVHRDVKPSNCLLTADSHPILKVTDFGLARAYCEAQENSFGLSDLDPEIGAQLTTVAGTPQYMSPEQFRPGAELDTRSDVYSFGIMFYQMLTGDLPPVGFLALSHIAKYVTRYDVPERLKQIIQLCVQLDPSQRPGDFGELRSQLAAAYQELTGEMAPPEAKPLEMSPGDLCVKGIGLKSLGYFKEACDCFKETDWIENAELCLGYGSCLSASGRDDLALVVYETALTINPNMADMAALWSNKGVTLESLNRSQEARVCFERALEIDPQNSGVWMNLGAILRDEGHLEHALDCFNRSLNIDQRNADAWFHKAIALFDMGRYEETLVHCGEGFVIHPRHHLLWNMRACALIELKRFEEALVACNRGIEIDENEPLLWRNKAQILEKISKPEEAEECRERAQSLEKKPPDKGFRAEIKIEDKFHLILIAKHTPAGPTTSIYDAKVKQWWKKEESAESFEDAMGKAEELTQAWYKRVVPGGQPLQFEWKPTTFALPLQRKWWAGTGINCEKS